MSRPRLEINEKALEEVEQEIAADEPVPVTIRSVAEYLVRVLRIRE